MLYENWEQTFNCLVHWNEKSVIIHMFVIELLESKAILKVLKKIVYPIL